MAMYYRSHTRQDHECKTPKRKPRLPNTTRCFKHLRKHSQRNRTLRENCTIARRKAEVKQNTLQIRYQHSQSDEESHLGKWRKDWGPLISEREGNLKLRFTKFENTPYLTLPQCMNNDEVQRRNSYRIHQANYNSRSTN